MNREWGERRLQFHASAYSCDATVPQKDRWNISLAIKQLPQSILPSGIELIKARYPRKYFAWRNMSTGHFWTVVSWHSFLVGKKNWNILRKAKFEWKVEKRARVLAARCGTLRWPRGRAGPGAGPGRAPRRNPEIDGENAGCLTEANIADSFGLFTGFGKPRVKVKWKALWILAERATHGQTEAKASSALLHWSQPFVARD